MVAASKTGIRRSRQDRPAKRSTSSRSREERGAKSFSSPEQISSKSSGFSPPITTDRALRPCLQEFMRDRSLPDALWGPVLLFAFALLAANCLAETIVCYPQPLPILSRSLHELAFQ